MRSGAQKFNTQGPQFHPTLTRPSAPSPTGRGAGGEEAGATGQRLCEFTYVVSFV
jgi:hypothetical protein